jgi:predicted restriction endonuclease
LRIPPGKIWRWLRNGTRRVQDLAVSRGESAASGGPTGDDSTKPQMPTKGIQWVMSSLRVRWSTTTWIARSTVIGDWVERLHDFTCQICGTRLVTPAGACAEMCQIKPLRCPHDGSDIALDILCPCPNCHVSLDELGTAGSMTICL